VGEVERSSRHVAQIGLRQSMQAATDGTLA
jgi:hypothetical protein